MMMYLPGLTSGYVMTSAVDTECLAGRSWAVIVRLSTTLAVPVSSALTSAATNTRRRVKTLQHTGLVATAHNFSLSENVLLVGKLSSKYAKFGLEIPILEELRCRIGILCTHILSVDICSCLSEKCTFLPPTTTPLVQHRRLRRYLLSRGLELRSCWQ